MAAACLLNDNFVSGAQKGLETLTHNVIQDQTNSPVTASNRPFSLVSFVATFQVFQVKLRYSKEQLLKNSQKVSCVWIIIRGKKE